MLAIETEFPQVGSHGWLKPDKDRPSVEPVRILQRNRDGTRLIEITSQMYRGACTANRRVELKQLAATQEEALPKGPRRLPYGRKRRGS